MFVNRMMRSGKKSTALGVIYGSFSLIEERTKRNPVEVFEQAMQNMYLDLRRQTQVISAFAGIAIFIAVLGLIGLAAHAAVSRTKEIGIRKAVGGGRLEIVRLLLWQFSRPVLLANVIAWPVAYYVMGAWLQGFARRVELDLWMFAGAAAVTLAVAIAAVSMHTWVMAGARPVEALRYQ